MKTLECNYCNKDGHIVIFGFIKKSHEEKEGHSPHTFIMSIVKIKKRKMSTYNNYSTNIKVPKKTWVPKVENSNCDAYDDTDNCSSSYTNEEINMLYCSTHMRD